ncbi:hypothetical protein GRJ2_000723000 [Grus japonensis]|uniref:Uncharacterized protein n=1 Tax=Grus japonensis TaxID=30415 RepID=A0ABC9WCZ5_GRUJA
MHPFLTWGSAKRGNSRAASEESLQIYTGDFHGTAQCFRQMLSMSCYMNNTAFVWGKTEKVSVSGKVTEEHAGTLKTSGK